MPLITWQLWLAKDLVEEHHLPWQSRLKNLTPGRVAQSLFSLLVGDRLLDLILSSSAVSLATQTPKPTTFDHTQLCIHLETNRT